MSTDDELRTRRTDPPPPMTDHDLLIEIMTLVAALAEELRAVRAETDGTAKAFHDVNAHLTAIRADSYLAIEQLQPIGTLVGELEARVSRLEARSRPPEVMR